MKRMPLTAKEAKCCCECMHWQKIADDRGECRHPQLYVGIVYRNETTGKESLTEWHVSGMYHSCLKWEEKISATPTAAGVA